MGDTPVFQGLLDKFLEAYVLCCACHLPEIDLSVRKGMVVGKCKACGWTGALDNNHRLAAFIIKNPPDDTGLQIIQATDAGGKLNKAERRAQKAKKKAEEEEQEGDGSDESEEEKEKKE